MTQAKTNQKVHLGRSTSWKVIPNTIAAPEKHERPNDGKKGHCEGNKNKTSFHQMFCLEAQNYLRRSVPQMRWSRACNETVRMSNGWSEESDNRLKINKF